MASLIDCPHCGKRPREEFTTLGSAVTRPAADASFETWADYVYLRENPRGMHDEFWHHADGCRRWLVVTRHTFTHEFGGTRDAASIVPSCNPSEETNLK